MLARVLLLAFAVSAAYAVTPLSYGPVISDLGCTSYNITMPNPNLFPPEGLYYYVYGTDLNYGYSSGEIYTNSLSTFMNVADGQGFLYWTIASNSGWTPNLGYLFVNLTLWSDAAHTTRIGSGNLTSYDFFARNFSDPLAPHGWVVSVGGNVTLEYDITTSSVLRSPNTGSGFGTNVWQPHNSVALYFPPTKNMWPEKETFTNRVFAPADAATFSAPLFNSSPAQKFYNTNTPLTAYTATYDHLISLWGSNGFSFSTDTYTNPNTAMDISLALTCISSSGTGHIVPPPPSCPNVPVCTGCTNTVTLSGACNSISTSTQASCLTVTVDDTLACSA